MRKSASSGRPCPTSSGTWGGTAGNRWGKRSSMPATLTGWSTWPPSPACRKSSPRTSCPRSRRTSPSSPSSVMSRRASRGCSRALRPLWTSSIAAGKGRRMRVYLGVDVGSVTTKVVALDEEEKVLAGLYLRTQGRPIETIQEGLRLIQEMLPSGVEVAGAGTTGSARYLAGVVAGADTIKNEITAHAVGALHFVPDVQTIVEIGGQDSENFILPDGVVTDFSMNTVCAAGTGAFLDQQASRLNIRI